MSWFINNAYAAATAAPANEAANGGWGSLLIPVAFLLVFYLLWIRPQSKRAKEHRNALASLSVGDEVITNGGIYGKVTKVTDDAVLLAIAEGIEIRLQKQAVATMLPKGSLSSLSNAADPMVKNKA